MPVLSRPSRHYLSPSYQLRRAIDPALSISAERWIAKAIVAAPVKLRPDAVLIAFHPP